MLAPRRIASREYLSICLAATDPGFVHLHVHSSYSLLEGALTIARLAELAKKDRQPALALTDTDNMFGALEFSEKMASAGIQPIIGCALGIDFADQDNRGGGRGRELAAHRAARRARERLSQPDAALLARLSRHRADRPSAHQARLARRGGGRTDRAQRRSQRPARCRHRRRPERAGARALRSVAGPVRRPALYRVAAPRHGGRAGGGAGLDRARLCARHCARRQQRAVLRHPRGLRGARRAPLHRRRPLAGRRRAPPAHARAPLQEPRRNGGLVRRSAGGAGGDRRDRRTLRLPPAHAGADPAALLHRAGAGRGGGRAGDQRSQEGARGQGSRRASPRRMPASSAGSPAIRWRPATPPRITASGSPSSSASSTA